MHDVDYLLLETSVSPSPASTKHIRGLADQSQSDVSIENRHRAFACETSPTRLRQRGFGREAKKGGKRARYIGIWKVKSVGTWICHAACDTMDMGDERQEARPQAVGRKIYGACQIPS